MQLGDAAHLAEQLKAALENLTFPPRSNEEMMTREALHAAAARLSYVTRSTPSAFVPEEWLIQVQAAFDPVIASVQRFARRKGHAPLDITSVEIGRLWNAIGVFLPAIAPISTVGEEATAFRRSANQLIRHLADDVREAEERLRRHEKRLEAAAGRQDMRLEDLRRIQADLRGAIDRQRAVLESSLAEQQRAFNAELQGFRLTLQERLKTSEKVVMVSLEDLQKQARSVIQRAEESVARLAELEEKARRSYNTVGNASVAGHYQKHADDEKKQANRWRWIAVSVFAASAVGFLIELVLRDGTVGWPETRSRLLLAIPLAALATFATAEARAHRKAERDSRRREVELSSLDPYLVLIEDRDRAEAIKLSYAHHLFIDNGASVAARDSPPERPEHENE